MKNIIKYIIEILLIVTLGLLLISNIKVYRIQPATPYTETFVEELNSNKSRFITDYRRLRFNNLPCIYDDIENPTKFDIEYPIIVE